MIWTKKGELIMLEFLQTGRMLYVLAAICALGTLSKLVTGSLYKRLIKETGNMALTKDKNLKALKQRMENIFLINHGIRNVNAYIEKQLYGFQFLHMSLDGWDNLSVQAMILCFMAGGAAAFGAYWYRCDNYYIVLYGAAGVFGGLFLAFVDNGIGAGTKRKQLADHLVDYVENSPHFYKSVDNSAYAGQERKKTAGSSDIVDLPDGNGARYGRNQENVRKEKLNGRFSVLGRKRDTQGDKGSEEMGCMGNGRFAKTRDSMETGNLSRLDGKLSSFQENEGDQAVNGNHVGSSPKKTMGKAEYGRSTSQNVRDIGQTGLESGGKAPTSETELAQSIDHLSESLKQIAASREQPGEMLKNSDRLELIRNSISPAELDMLKTIFNTLQGGGV